MRKITLLTLIIGILISAGIGARGKTMELSLSESIRYALENNADLKMEKLKMQRAELSLSRSRANFGPDLNLTAYPTTLRAEPSSLLSGDFSSISLDGPWANLYFDIDTSMGTSFDIGLTGEMDGTDLEGSLYVSISQRFFPSPKWNWTFRSFQNSLRDVEKRKLYLEDKERWLKYEVMAAFYNVLKKERQVALDELYLRTQRENLRDVENKLRKGEVEEKALLSAQVDLVLEEVDLSNSKNRLYEYLTKFKNFLNLDPETELVLLGDHTYQDRPLGLSLEEAVEEALRNRSDMKRKMIDVEAKEFDVKYYKGIYSPSVDLKGRLNFYTTGYEELEIRAVIKIPLWDSGKKRLEVEKAKNSLEETSLFLQKLKRDITSKVKKSFQELNHRKQKIAYYELIRRKYEELYEVSKKEFSEGKIGRYQFLLREVDSRSAEKDLFNMILDHRLERAYFLKYIGRDFDTES